MKKVRICFVGMLVLYSLSGCGTSSQDNEVAVKNMVMTSPQQSVNAEELSRATVLDIGKSTIEERPGVTRIMIMLDKEASYSIAQEGNQLIVNVLNAKMRSSLKQVEVQDPVIKSIVAMQVDTGVKSIVELISPDVAYRPSTSSLPFQIFLDIWQISPQTALAYPPESQTKPVVSVPPKAIDVEVAQVPAEDLAASQRVKELTLDVREPSRKDVTLESKTPQNTQATITTAEKEEKDLMEKVSTLTPATTVIPSSQDVPTQLQWFSEKLSQVLQEKEKLNQELLEVEKNFVAKDSMVQVLEKKLQDANTRIGELEEGLITTKSKTSLMEQNEISLRSSLQQETSNLSQAQNQIRMLQSQIDALIKQHEALQTQNELYTSEVISLKAQVERIAVLENELQTKDRELNKLRKVIEDAAKLFIEQSAEPASVSPPRPMSQPSNSGSQGPQPTVTSTMPPVSSKTVDTASQPVEAQQFYIVGSVINPGVYAYRKGETVLDGILRAGGLTEFASPNNTKLIRDSDGKTQTFLIRLKDVMEKGEMDKNVEVAPGDMIIVPESF